MLGDGLKRGRPVGEDVDLEALERELGSDISRSLYTGSWR
jgi:hypothetical protein